MRIEAKRQQSKSPHERGVRHPLGLMEPIVGALFEPRSGHTATHERPAEESRSIHDQLDEPHSPSDRLHHCLCTFCRWRLFVPMKCREEDRKKKKRKKKENQAVERPKTARSLRRPSSIGWTSLVPTVHIPSPGTFLSMDTPFRPNRTGLPENTHNRDYSQSEFCQCNEVVLSKRAVFTKTHY